MTQINYSASGHFTIYHMHCFSSVVKQVSLAFLINKTNTHFADRRKTLINGVFWILTTSSGVLVVTIHVCAGHYLPDSGS